MTQRQIGVVHSTWLGRALIAGPNLLTLARAGLAPLVFVAAVAGWAWWALSLYMLGLVTDFFDGIMARTFASGSPFGRAMDSTADKMLVSAGLLALVHVGRIPTWLLLAFVLREFATFGLRAVRPIDGSIIADINDALGRLRFFVLHVGMAMLLWPVPPGRERLWTIGLWTVVAAIAIAWTAFAFYLHRDRWKILASMRHSQADDFKLT